MTEVVAVDCDGAVLTVTITRPDQRNAGNGEVARGIAAALDQLDGDAGLRAGVLTSERTPTSC